MKVKNKEHKKVKNFNGYLIVSQDITIGDEIIDITDKGEREGMLFKIVDEDKNNWITDDFGHHVIKKDAYKIIKKTKT